MGREHLTYYPDDRDVCARDGSLVGSIFGAVAGIPIHERRWSQDEVGYVFAAAPELLEAAECALDVLRAEYDGAPDSSRRFWSTHIDQLERAIAKARGKEASHEA